MRWVDSRSHVFTITPNSDIRDGWWVVGCNEFSEREELFVSYGKACGVFPPEENGNHPSISTVVKIYGCNLIFFLVFAGKDLRSNSNKYILHSVCVVWVHSSHETGLLKTCHTFRFSVTYNLVLHLTIKFEFWTAKSPGNSHLKYVSQLRTNFFADYT